MTRSDEKWHHRLNTQLSNQHFCPKKSLFNLKWTLQIIIGDFAIFVIWWVRAEVLICLIFERTERKLCAAFSVVNIPLITWILPLVLVIMIYILEDTTKNVNCFFELLGKTSKHIALKTARSSWLSPLSLQTLVTKWT